MAHFQLWLEDGQQVASAAQGVQQGDPLGSLLFSLALNKLLRDAGAEFVSGFLDDIGLGDTVPRLVEQIRRLECAANKIGLQLSHHKCKIFDLSGASRLTSFKPGLNFVIRPVEEASLLGSPVHSHGVEPALAARSEQLERVLPRLGMMAGHETFFLLRTCFACPRLLCARHPAAHHPVLLSWMRSSRTL